jgi:hypothetical protein
MFSNKAKTYLKENKMATFENDSKVSKINGKEILVSTSNETQNLTAEEWSERGFSTEPMIDIDQLCKDNNINKGIIPLTEEADVCEFDIYEFDNLSSSVYEYIPVTDEQAKEYFTLKEDAVESDTTAKWKKVDEWLESTMYKNAVAFGMAKEGQLITPCYKDYPLTLVPLKTVFE